MVCFALQSMLFAAAVEGGAARVRHASLYRLPLACIWESFADEGAPCVYVIASLAYNSEYIGSTSNFRGHLYAHARHIHTPGRAGKQRVHTYVRRFQTEFVWL